MTVFLVVFIGFLFLLPFIILFFFGFGTILFGVITGFAVNPKLTAKILTVLGVVVLIIVIILMML